MFRLFNLLSTNRFIGYLFIGSFNTIVSIAVYALLLWLGIHYILASSITFVFGVLEGYTLNSLLVFKQTPHFKSLSRFVLIYCVSLGLNLIIMYIQVELLHIDKLIAQIISSLILAGVNFYLIKIFVYKL